MTDKKALNQMLKALRQSAEDVLSKADALEKALNDVSEAPTKQDTAPAITLADVKALLMEKARSGLNDEVHALIQSYGVEKLSQVDSSNYEELMKKAQEIGNG